MILLEDMIHLCLQSDLGLFADITVIWVPYILYRYVFYSSAFRADDSYAFPPIFEVKRKFVGIV